MSILKNKFLITLIIAIILWWILWVNLAWKENSQEIQYKPVEKVNRVTWSWETNTWSWSWTKIDKAAELIKQLKD